MVQAENYSIQLNSFKKDWLLPISTTSSNCKNQDYLDVDLYCKYDFQEQQQLQALIVEKKMEFERLRIEYESLLKVEAEEQEFIEQLILQS